MSDLRPVHVEEKLDPGNTGKMTAGALVLLAVLVLGGYGYHIGMFSPQSAVSDSQLPQPSLPHNATN
jgi:hypothetical protein